MRQEQPAHGLPATHFVAEFPQSRASSPINSVCHGREKLLWEITLGAQTMAQGTSTSILCFKDDGVSAILDCAHQVRPITTIK